MAGKRTEKASNYVSQLYEARCNRDWQAVPELARKVDKHAKNRKGLTAASRAEASLFGPGQSKATPQEQARSQLVALLKEERDANETIDIAVTLASIHLKLKEYNAALKTVPSDLQRIRRPDQGSGQASWTAVCVVQGTLVRGMLCPQY